MSTIKLKRSGTTGSVPGPDDLVQGELAINYADNKLYALSHDNVTVVDLLAVADQVGVATFNGLSGDVFGVGSFNGLTGDIQGVSAWNGSTGAVVFNDYVATFNGLTGAIQGVSAWNGLTGNVDITNSLVQVGGLSAGSGATFAGLVKLIGGLSADAGATFAGSVNFKGGISADSGATFDGDLGFAGNHHIRNSSGQSIFDANSGLNVYIGDSEGAGNETDIFIRDSHSLIALNADNEIELNTPIVEIEGKLRHKGDTNTYLDFTPDGITMAAGGNVLFSGDATDLNIRTGISADAGATFAGAINTTAGTSDLNALKTGALLINDNYNLPTGAGATGDILMIANDGDLEFESLKMSANFVVDSDIPLATGVRYKALYQVPMAKMAVTEITLRSDDVSPAGSGDSLSVALKGIFRTTELDAASPTIASTIETVTIPLGGEYSVTTIEANVDNPNVGGSNGVNFLVVDVTANAGNHTNFCMVVTMEARP